MQIYTWPEQVYIYTGVYIFTCDCVHMPKNTPGANYTYMYNLHTVCKSAHMNGA